MLDNFPVGSPLDFNLPGAEISFDLILDKEASYPENQGTSAGIGDLPGPYYEGYKPPTITITKADVDAYSSILGGVITDNLQFAGLLNWVLGAHGASVSANIFTGNPSVRSPTLMSISTRQINGNGSYVEIANLSSVGVSTGGLKEGFDYGTRGSAMELAFKEFIVHEDGDNVDGVVTSFTFSLNGGTPTTHSFNRTNVNTLLGKQTGKVETPEEMATLLHSLLDADWPDLIIEATSPTSLVVKLDPAVDRKWGLGPTIKFDNIRVSIEPLAVMNFLDIDIVQNPEMVASYLQYIEVVSGRITDGAATLGALQSRIEMQSEFAAKLSDSIDKGIGRLVDADMNEASTRLKALQTQEQLAIQSLSIANSSSETILSLFR